MTTPAALRGNFYSTPLTLRCPDYKMCPCCLMCSNYNPHNPVCVVCESRKPAGKHHECSDARVEGTRLMEEIVGRPFFSVNHEPSDVVEDICTTSFDPQKQELINRLHRLMNEQKK